MTLPTRKIGSASVPVPGWGCMGFTALYANEKSDAEFVPTFKAAYEAGCRMWDTADIYGRKEMGENERLIGKVIRELGIPREDLFICTKFGVQPDWSSVRGDAEYVRSALEKSLEALGTDYVDLYYQHRVDPNTPIEETVRAMKELQDAGKIRHIGLSECSASTLRRASKIAKIDAVQIEYSLFETAVETNGVLAACRELGITFVAYSPLGRGMLSGKFRQRSDLAPDDWRLTIPRFSEENFPKNVQLVDQISAMAKTKGCTPGQLALAWIFAQGENVMAIPGTTRTAALLENIECTKVTLSKEELAESRALLDQFPVAGTRYDAASMAGVNI